MCTNRDFLRTALDHPPFVAGTHNTSLVADLATTDRRLNDRRKSRHEFTIDDLMALLVAKAGLPAPDAHRRSTQRRFADVGLDSLAFLQLQAELQARYGFELPDDRPQTYTFGEIVADVNDRLA